MTDVHLFFVSTAQNEQAAPATGAEKQKSRKTVLFWGHVLAFLFGLGLLLATIWYVGYQTIIDALTRVGWGFLIIIGLNVLRQFLRSASLYLAIDPEKRTFGYLSAVSARFGGEAVTFLTFTGPFLGDATKAMLLRNKIPLTYGASAVVIDNILYYVSVAMMMIGGVIALAFIYGSQSPAMTNVLIGIVAAAIIVLLILVAALAYQVTPFSRILDYLERKGRLPRFLARIQPDIRRVETNVFRFYKDRRRDFFVMFLISCVVHLVSVVEVYAALRLLGYDASLTTSFIIESLTKVVNVVFGFVPGTIGVYEGGNGVILLSLGYTVAVGVALALVRRGAILFSLFAGLAVLLWRLLGRGAKRLDRD